MSAHRALEANTTHEKPFDTKEYLLDRYGLRMNKRDVCFQAKKSRATIDNMRNRHHRNFDTRLKNAEISDGTGLGEGVPVLFKTVAIADWLEGVPALREISLPDTNSSTVKSR